MNSDSAGQTGLFALAAGVYAVLGSYDVGRPSFHDLTNPSDRHNLIKSEKFMFQQVGNVESAVGGRDTVHVFKKKNSRDRECKDAFKFYRPVHITQWAFNTYNAVQGEKTVFAGYPNGVSGSLTTSTVNAALNACFGFLNSSSNWSPTPSNQVMGLLDPGVTTPAMPRCLLSQALGTDSTSQAVANTTVTWPDPNFRYLLGPTSHTLLLENMAPYMTDVEVYIIQPKYDNANDPLGCLKTAAPEANDMEGSTTFFPKENIDEWGCKPTMFRVFNERYRIVKKKNYRLAAGTNIELSVRTKGWKKITNSMVLHDTPVMPSTTFFIYIRARGPSGWVKALGEVDGGICNIPVKIGYRVKESISVIPCPYNVEKRARLRSDLTNYTSLANVQFFNKSTGQPTNLSAAAALASSMMGVA